MIELNFDSVSVCCFQTTAVGFAASADLAKVFPNQNPDLATAVDLAKPCNKGQLV